MITDHSRTDHTYQNRCLEVVDCSSSSKGQETCRAAFNFRKHPLSSISTDCKRSQVYKLRSLIVRNANTERNKILLILNVRHDQHAERQGSRLKNCILCTRSWRSGQWSYRDHRRSVLVNLFRSTSRARASCSLSYLRKPSCTKVA